MKEGVNADEMSDLLNKQSGVLGILVFVRDIREVKAGIATGNERAKLAMEMYDYRVRSTSVPMLP